MWPAEVPLIAGRPFDFSLSPKKNQQGRQGSLGWHQCLGPVDDRRGNNSDLRRKLEKKSVIFILAAVLPAVHYFCETYP